MNHGTEEKVEPASEKAETREPLCMTHETRHAPPLQTSYPRPISYHRVPFIVCGWPSSFAGVAVLPASYP
jgi:hypothetical protein